MSSAPDVELRDEHTMRRALELASRGPESDPNPRVGCVITDAGGTVVGEGWHRGAGTDHAEVVALTAAGERARGGTAYVSLEPCNHTGRTGPCTEALIAAGVGRVVHAQTDPNTRAAGGAQVLREAGVSVVAGVLEKEATRLNSTWTHLMRTGMPWVTWKMATSLDGRIAAADGTSQWITGPEARADVHERRYRSGAIVVGTGTVLIDDPHLTARRPDGTPYPVQPIRVVMGERDIPGHAKILDAAAPTLHLRTRDPKVVLSTLAGHGVHHVWLEGGPTIAGGFLTARLVDEVIAYVAPVLIGRGRHVVTDLGITTISEAMRLHDPEITRVGEDVRFTATLSERP